MDDEDVIDDAQQQASNASGDLGPSQLALVALQAQIDDITNQIQTFIAEGGKGSAKKIKQLKALLSKLAKQQAKLSVKANKEAAIKSKVAKQEAKSDAKVGVAEAKAEGKVGAAEAEANAEASDPLNALIAQQLGDFNELDAGFQFDELAGDSFGIDTATLLGKGQAASAGGATARARPNVTLVIGVAVVAVVAVVWWRRRRKHKAKRTGRR